MHVGPAHIPDEAKPPARVTALAQHVLGGVDEANAWLFQRHPLLGDQTPIEVAVTALGARQVERILRDIEFGLPV